MPKLSDAQLDVCPGATGEPRSRPFVGIGTEVRRRLGLAPDEARPSMPCLLPRDAKGRIVRGVDPHEWAAVVDPPDNWPPGPWLKCERCGQYTTAEPRGKAAYR